jgi:hypothetical protein
MTMLSHTAGVYVERRDDPAAAARVDAANIFGRSLLDLDLTDRDRLGLITTVLTAALPSFGAAPDAQNNVWQWTMPERLQGLLAIAMVTRRPPPPVNTRCQAGACHMPMRVEIDLAALVREPRRDPIVCELSGHRITARLPHGSDQVHWRDTKADLAAMATRLIESVDGHVPDPGWRVPPDWLDELGAALAECDPLTVLQLNATCPNCGHANLIDFDIEDLLLRLLADEQNDLLDDVHALAAAYHWSEADICALPRQRRRAYRERISREAAR